MTWALRRQIVYVGILILCIFVFGFLIIYPRLNKAPSCVDNKQNGTETGVDCGGSCPRACITQVDEISILWARSFKVVAGRYNVVAYLENHNKNTAINKIGYRFRFADANNIYIGKREGITYVPPSGKFAVFEPAIDVGNSLPIYTSFEFTEIPEWIQVSAEKINQLNIVVSDSKLTDETTMPKLSAVLKNQSLFTIPEVNVVAILYDALGNAVAVSRTYLDALLPEESKNINFTWPESLPTTVVAKEIIPLYNIFRVQLK